MKAGAARNIVSLLLLFMVLCVILQTADAQTPLNYRVTVSAATPNNAMYSTVGHNLTVAFQAVWTFGDNIGQAIENANVTVEVKTSKDQIIDMFNATTNVDGFLSFNYSAQMPDILAFTPVKLFSQDGKEWNSTLVQGESNLYGLKSDSISVYYDTFDVALLGADTTTRGVTRVTVNVTYLLVPDEGLTLPPQSSYLNQTFFPKIAHGADVTINGVKAQESAELGVYNAEFSTLFPTAYVLVVVSQEGWAPNQEAFSVAHTANAALWVPATITLGAVFIVVSLALYVVLARKSKAARGLSASFQFVGGISLLATSFISLYWGAIGVESTIQGFNWILLIIAGLASFALGIAGSVMAWKRKNQALVLFTVCLSMLANVFAVKISLDVYQLATPLLMVTLAFGISVISGVLIANSDNKFLHAENEPAASPS